MPPSCQPPDVPAPAATHWQGPIGRWLGSGAWRSATSVQRPEDLGHLVRQLADPRQPGRGGRRPGLRAPGARRGHHDLRHRGRLRRHEGRERARQGAGGGAPRRAGDLHEGLLADQPRQAQRPRAVAQAHHDRDRRLAAPARHRLRRPLPGAPLRLRDPARGDDGGLRRRRALRQGALHRRLGVAGRGHPPGARARPRAAHPRWSRTSRSTTCCGGSSRRRWCPPARSSASARSSGRRSPRAR